MEPGVAARRLRPEVEGLEHVDSLLSVAICSVCIDFRRARTSHSDSVASLQ